VVQPIIHTSVDQYIVQVNLSTGSTEQFIFNIVDTCYNNVRVHWMNRLGGYDWFDFELSARDNYSVERRSMKQVPDVVVQTGTVTYSKQDRVNLDYWVKEKRKTTLTSNWITGEQSEWLKDMLSSQDIYLEIGGEYIAVNIDQANYDVKYEDRDELFNLEVALTNAASTIVDDSGCFLVAYDNLKPVGFLWGCARALPWSKEKLAFDTILYVIPEKRKTSVGYKLMNSWEEWAREHNAVEVQISIASGIHEDSSVTFFKKMGYHYIGQQYRKEINYGE